MKRFLMMAVLCGAALLAWAGVAQAHVAASPSEQPAGGFTKIEFRVPVERDVPTTKVDIKLPDGVVFVSVQPIPGWTFETKTAKLDEPIVMEDGDKIEESVSEVIFSGGKINPGEFQAFDIALKLPEKGEQGDYLFFPTLQTYQGGEVVSWIEKPEEGDDPSSLERPAPYVTLTSGEESDDTPTVTSDTDDNTKYASDEHVHKHLNWLYGISIAALALALVAFVSARKRRS